MFTKFYNKYTGAGTAGEIIYGIQASTMKFTLEKSCKSNVKLAPSPSLRQLRVVLSAPSPSTS